MTIIWNRLEALSGWV